MKYFVVFCLSVLPLLVACNKARHNRVLGDAVREPSGLEQAVKNSASYLDKGKPSPFRIDATRVKGVDDLRAISFADERHGWIGGDDKLYRTADGGRTWSQVTIKLPPGSNIASILFLSPSLGWVVLQRPISSVLEHQGSEFWLMQTSDGGESWQLQLSSEKAVVTDLSFADQNNGWLTGIKYLGPARYTRLILHTSDQGHHWADVSENLTTAHSHKEAPREISERVIAPHKINDGIMRVIPTGVHSAKVITGRKAVFVTSDGGMSWQPVAVIRDDSDQQAGIRRFGENNKTLWVAGGADSVEGTRGVLLIQRPDDSWSRYELGGVYFADAASSLPGQFVACGYVKVDERHKARREGLVTYSADAGQSWTIVYQSREVNAVNALAFLTPNQVLAVGGGGLFLRAERVSSEGSAAAK